MNSAGTLSVGNKNLDRDTPPLSDLNGVCSLIVQVGMDTCW